MKHTVTAMKRESKGRVDMAYVVKTTDGHTAHKTDAGLTEQAAKADAAMRNKWAADLGIKVRYEAVKAKAGRS
jgi:hypothetical protein